MVRGDRRFTRPQGGGRRARGGRDVISRPGERPRRPWQRYVAQVELLSLPPAPDLTLGARKLVVAWWRNRVGSPRQVEVEVVAPPSAYFALVELRLQTRVASTREPVVERALCHGEQRPVGVAQDGKGWVEHLGAGRDGSGKGGAIGGKLRRDGLRHLWQVVCDGSHVRERQLPRILQQSHTLRHLAEVQRVVETCHDVGTHLRDLEHLSKLLNVAGDQIQEREALHVLGTLVRHLHHLVIALFKRLRTQLLPVFFAVERVRRL
mmetsp:Transcript_20775/g.51893  ORF Transcript_20775/g.51893 Transcript_20775/m.51893 type:complete len:264 (-) Transcript_20775:2103-2894(-)